MSIFLLIIAGVVAVWLFISFALVSVAPGSTALSGSLSFYEKQKEGAFSRFEENTAFYDRQLREKRLRAYREHQLDCLAEDIKQAKRLLDLEEQTHILRERAKRQQSGHTMSRETADAFAAIDSNIAAMKRSG